MSNTKQSWRKISEDAWEDEVMGVGYVNESPSFNFKNGFEQGADKALNMVQKKVNQLFNNLPSIVEAETLSDKLELATAKIQLLEIAKIIEILKDTPDDTL